MHIKMMCLVGLAVVFLAVIPYVWAGQGEIDLNAFPAALAEKLNVSLLAGRIMASCILFALVTMPVLMASRRNFLLPLIAAFLALGLDVALGWLDYWFLIIISVVVAILFSGKAGGWIGGGRD